MATYQTTRVLPFHCGHLFDLVADVESYPGFVPYWRSAKIYERGEGFYFTEQEIVIGMLRERFRSKTVLEYPTRIKVTPADKSYHSLDIRWGFELLPDEQCRVRFAQACGARSFLMQAALDILLANTAEHTVAAFERRAHELFAQ